MPERILVTGARGMVGSRYAELHSYPERLITPTSRELDISDIASVTEFVQKHKLDVVINFAAYTNVSEDEKERGDKEGPVWEANVTGVSNLVEAIDPDKVHLIQISTDMVFPGSETRPGPYSETDTAESDSSQLTWYGFTKAEAEGVIQTHLSGKASILRINNPVRSNFAAKLDYLRKPLELYDTGKLYPTFDDQQITVTFIDEACTAINNIIAENRMGTFHAASRDLTTPYQIISEMIIKSRGGNSSDIKTASIKEFLATVDNPVRYPIHGGLDVKFTQSTLDMKFSTTSEIVDELIRQGI